jgi:hypothetical protein
MQLRCTYCQTMFNITRDEMLAGLEHMEEQKLAFYDAHCPKCRRANRVERAKMERFYPDWKKTLKTMAKESTQPDAGGDKPDGASRVDKPEAAASQKKPARAKKA